jgi:cyclic pyranopterin phosphate synthase
MPEEGVAPRRHEDLLTFEEIVRIITEAARLGIRKVRLTGGEPLVRRGITDLVGMVKAVPGIELVSITTNGTLLGGMAAGLRAAGLDSINVSLDTLDPDRYAYLTRGGNIREVLEGLDAAAAEGFPIKINMVVLDTTGEDDISAMRAFCETRGFTPQLINHFSLTEEKHKAYEFDRPPKCAVCNRIRLTADGKLKPCLHTNTEIPADFADLRGSLLRAIESKPECGSVCSNRNMVEIGG